MVSLSLLSAAVLVIAALVVLAQLFQARRPTAPDSRVVRGRRRSAAIAAVTAAVVCVAVAGANVAHWLEVRHATAPSWVASHAAAGGEASTDHGADMQAAIASLAAKLREHPDDGEGWILLARTYKALQRGAEAQDAYRHALEAVPEGSDLARESAAGAAGADTTEGTMGSAVMEGADVLTTQEVAAVGLQPESRRRAK